jgi:hypothetical protein
VQGQALTATITPDERADRGPGCQRCRRDRRRRRRKRRRERRFGPALRSGGGGGVSGTTIGIIGAAVAGGAVAATQVIGKEAGDDLREFAGPFFRSAQPRLLRLHPGPRNSGTLTIEINNLDGPFTGTVHVGGTSRVIAFSSGNCPNGPQVGTNEPYGHLTVSD